MILQRLALCVAFSGLFVAFCETSAPCGSDVPDATIQGRPSSSQLDSTSLSEFMAAPDSRRPGLAGGSEAATPSGGEPHLEIPSRVDADAVLIATSLFEKYRAFRESLSTP